MAELENTNEMMIQLPWAVPQQPLVMTQIQIDPETKKIPIDLNVSSTDWVVAASIAISGLISLIGFLITVYVVKKSTESQIASNENLIKQQENLKIRELKILNKNSTLDKVKELLSENLYLAGNMQNQIEISVNELQHKSFNNLYLARNHGDLKNVINEYQSSIKRLNVYLGKETRQAEELNHHFREMELLSWGFYTANMDGLALNETLRQWIKEFKKGEILVQRYVNNEFDSIYKN